jgi:hypothetical protein
MANGSFPQLRGWPLSLLRPHSMPPLPSQSPMKHRRRRHMADTTEALRLLEQLREDEWKSGLHRTASKAEQASATAALLRIEIERLAASPASPAQPMTPEHAQQAFGHVGLSVPNSQG